MKINLKNLTQTRCPICFNKLRLDVKSGKIPSGICFTINGIFYKKDMKKTEKSNEYYFSMSRRRIVAKVVPIHYNKTSLRPHVRLKLNNKMAKNRFIEEYSKMVNYTMWECVNENCAYYKCIDDVEYDFSRK